MRLLIKPQALQEDVFNQILSNYRVSPYKSVIARTIPHIIASYEDGYVETHLVSGYAALESMVAGIGDVQNASFALGNNPFKRLTKKISALIRQEVPDVDTAQSMIKKIPELNRKSFLDRLLFLLEQSQVNTDLIWPPGIDQRDEFHNILKRRNRLIHTGAIDQGGLFLFDLNRIQKLVELWILKLLDCPPDAINELSLWHDAPINKVLHY